ncbi:DUF58 domain-containing protein [Ruania halotolerans]|uniref:DUF58 domain-containing protein n=1 Tax=Ruania halotolerans TaxID=2897773 RepID=UPI001E540553|nr:DUF58 domain-containing protein [Ruania halotolerans]UFU04925.1 DUF58 domain-containing protein [Ruania halotolerans]
MSTPARERAWESPGVGTTRLGLSTSSITRGLESLRGSMRRTTSALSWITLPAWVVLAVGVISWIAGSVLGWMELVVLGAALVATFVVCGFFAIGRHPYAITLRLREGRVVAGERAMGGIEVRNTGSAPVMPARMELPVGPSLARFALPALAPGGEHDELFAIPTERRAVLVVGPVRSVRGDPFGLIRRAVQWTEPEELYVHPRTIPLGSASAGSLHDLEGLASKDVTNSDLSFHALREYVPGDDRRYVHWRSSARVGELMVRQFEETRRTHLVTALSVHGHDYEDADEFELAVSVVGSLGLHTLRSESELSALTQLGAIGTRGPRDLLDSLTRLDTVRRPGRLPDLARVVTRDITRATVAILVCGGGVSHDQLRAAGAVLPVGVRALAVQCRTGVQFSARRLGAVTMLELGRLEDLPRGFRRLQR